MRISPRSAWFVVAALTVTACSSSELPRDVLGTRWAWKNARYTITFMKDGVYAVEADCNAMMGAYQRQGDRLYMRGGLSTGKDCGPASSHDEYVALLGRVGGFRVEDGTLILTYDDGAGEMVFSRAGGRA